MSFLFRCLFIALLTSTTTLWGNYWNSTHQLSVGLPTLRPYVSVDRYGVTVAVWEEKALGASLIKGAILPANSTSWIPTGNLSNSGVLDRSFPIVKHDDKGNAIAIWLEIDGNQYVIRSAQLAKDQFDWISLGDVSPRGLLTKEQHQLAVNDHGKAVAIWIETSEGVSKLFGSKREPGDNWFEAPLPLSPPSYNVTTPALAIDGKGTAVAIWRHFGQGINVIAGAILPFNSDVWTRTGILGSKEPPQSPHLAMNTSGKAVAVWAEGYSPKIKVKAATLVVGGTDWVPTSDISAGLALSQQIPKVAINNKGNAIVTYIGLNGSKQVLKAAILPQSTAIWSRTSDASFAADKIIPEGIGLNQEGNAVAVFQEVKGSFYTLKGSTLAKNAQKWSFTNDLSNSENKPISVSAAFNFSGASIAVYNRVSPGITNIEGSVRLGVFPVLTFSGKQESDRIIIKKTWFNKLSWSQPNLGSVPARYRIFRDATLTQEIAVVPGTQFSFVDEGLKNQAYTYYIVSEDAFGGRSAAVGTTVSPQKKSAKSKMEDLL